MPEPVRDIVIIIIGGGPAGLRAAEVLAEAGHPPIVVDRMPSVGRKLLVAGVGGLNLTHSEPLDRFAGRYGDPARWEDLLAGFPPDETRAWAGRLGIETFVGTSGRVFPVHKQAAPLLRRWVSRLREQGVRFLLRHRWLAIEPAPQGAWLCSFAGPKEPLIMRAPCVLLALGGASWPQTGSDGSGVEILRRHGVAVVPWEPSNCGWECPWPPDFLDQAEGRPLKNIEVAAGSRRVRGELLVTRYGLEGGALYQLGPALREMERPAILIDLKPTHTPEALVQRLGPASSDHLLEQAGRQWKLSPAAHALLGLHGPYAGAAAMAARAKAVPVAFSGPRPLTEAISSAGGIAWTELDDTLMLRRLPGVFAAGEMIAWDAPTGGYLLQGCLATGTRAAAGIIQRLGAGNTANQRSV